MTKPDSVASRDDIPSIVRRLNPLVVRALRIGIPMGPNVLLTVPGRRTGEPRTSPVAILKQGGREFVFSPFGEVNWVHNLRAAGTATIRTGRRHRMVDANELPPRAAAPLLEAGLRPVLKVPLIGPMIAGWYGIDRDSTAEDFVAAARHHPAFELHGVERGVESVGPRPAAAARPHASDAGVPVVERDVDRDVQRDRDRQ